MTRQPDRRYFLKWTAAGLAACCPLTTAAKEPASSQPANPMPELPVTGHAQASLSGLDDLMTRLLREHGFVGGELAVAQGKRLVYARGFGHADREADTPVQPNSLFRIASVSKPITSIAVLQLVERGKLELSTRIAAVLDMKEVRDARWRDVTIEHLLQHTGGWDRDKSGDPMFRSVEIAQHCQQPPPADQQQILKYMAQEELDFDPGQRMAYSNFGYMLLGLAIARVAGVTYEEYVRRELFEPLEIKHARLGKTLLAGRAAGEVRYYDPHDARGPAVMPIDDHLHVGDQVPLPYGAWNLEAMDAHGGWIASAPELVRLASSFDDAKQAPLLGPTSIAQMMARPLGAAGQTPEGKPKDSYYGCGWAVRPHASGRHTIWHQGRLDGTSTLLVRRHDGMSWAALFNVSLGKDDVVPAEAIDGPMHTAIDAVSDWPTADLFGD